MAYYYFSFSNLADFGIHPLRLKLELTEGAKLASQIYPKFDVIKHPAMAKQFYRQHLHATGGVSDDPFFAALDRLKAAYKRANIPYELSPATELRLVNQMLSKQPPMRPRKAPSGTVNVPRGQYKKINGQRIKINDTNILY